MVINGCGVPASHRRQRIKCAIFIEIRTVFDLFFLFSFFAIWRGSDAPETTAVVTRTTRTRNVDKKNTANAFRFIIKIFIDNNNNKNYSEENSRAGLNGRRRWCTLRGRGPPPLPRPGSPRRGDDATTAVPHGLDHI